MSESARPAGRHPRLAARTSLGELAGRLPPPPHRRRRPARSSLPLELRLPLLDERADPLARVLGRERLQERVPLGGQALVEIAGVRDLLDLLQRDRRLAGVLTPPGERLVEQLVIGDDAVREPVLVRLVG